MTPTQLAERTVVVRITYKGDPLKFPEIAQIMEQVHSSDDGVYQVRARKGKVTDFPDHMVGWD